MPWLEISTVPVLADHRPLVSRAGLGPDGVSPEIQRHRQGHLTAGKNFGHGKGAGDLLLGGGPDALCRLELGLSAFQPHPASEVCRNRYGDCKDMATLLVTMLHEAGIKTAWPVLLGAGSSDPVQDLHCRADLFQPCHCPRRH